MTRWSRWAKAPPCRLRNRDAEAERWSILTSASGSTPVSADIRHREPSPRTALVFFGFATGPKHLQPLADRFFFDRLSKRGFFLESVDRGRVAPRAAEGGEDASGVNPEAFRAWRVRASRCILYLRIGRGTGCATFVTLVGTGQGDTERRNVVQGCRHCCGFCGRNGRPCRKAGRPASCAWPSLFTSGSF